MGGETWHGVEKRSVLSGIAGLEGVPALSARLIAGHPLVFCGVPLTVCLEADEEDSRRGEPDWEAREGVSCWRCSWWRSR